MIQPEKMWLAIEPVDMRAGPDTLLAHVVREFGKAPAHHAFLFTNKRCNRLKVLIHDGHGIWLLARRLHEGRFHWLKTDPVRARVVLSEAQWQSLIVGLPWQRLDADQTIAVL